MDDDRPSPTTDRLLGLEAPSEPTPSPAERVDELACAPADVRKTTIRSLRDRVDAAPDAAAALLPLLSTFLTDEERAVRLSTAKLFVAVARETPEVVESTVPALAERLADEAEFYFVRARAAEALGYVALASPDVVANPETIADLTIGLAFDEEAVRRKLAKALEHVAIGDPARLTHHVETLAEHVDDECELVRYHCCTALAAIACEQSAAVAPVVDDLVDRFEVEPRDDEGAYVAGRVAEALGILARADDVSVGVPELIDGTADAFEESFAADRIEFATSASDAADVGGDATPSRIGTIEGIHATTGDAVEAMTAPADCPNCGIARPPQGPPVCPGCGGPL